MYTKQGTKELGKGESGRMKRNTQDSLGDQSGSGPVLLPEGLCVNLCVFKNSDKNVFIRTLSQ